MDPDFSVNPWDKAVEINRFATNVCINKCDSLNLNEEIDDSQKECLGLELFNIDMCGRNLSSAAFKFSDFYMRFIHKTTHLEK